MRLKPEYVTYNDVTKPDADRRLLPHAAVLVGQWHERRLKREVHKPSPEEWE